MMKFIFGMEVNVEVFYNLILSFWVCVARHAQSIQNNKLIKWLQYLKENMKDELYFLSVDKHQSFLQIDIINLGLCGQACPNYPK